MQRKKGVHYCNQRTDACKMHIHVPMYSTSININLLWLLFQKIVYEYAHLCNWHMLKYSIIVCKTHSFVKQKYFAPVEMLYTILEVCCDIH